MINTIKSLALSIAVLLLSLLYGLAVGLSH